MSQQSNIYSLPDKDMDDDEIAYSCLRKWSVTKNGSLTDEQGQYLTALCQNDYRTVEWCLNKGVDINTRTEDGTPPLSVASALAGGDLFEMLLERGINVNACDYFNRSPLHTLASFDFVHKMKAVLKRGINVHPADKLFRVAPVNRAASDGAIRCLTLLLDAGANMEHQTVDHQTPLLNAASLKHPDCCVILLKRGADPKATDDWGRTALHFLAALTYAGPSEFDLQQMKLKAASLLMQGGCPVMPDKSGIWPQDIAAAQPEVDLAFLKIVTADCVRPVNHQPRLSFDALKNRKENQMA